MLEIGTNRRLLCLEATGVWCLAVATGMLRGEFLPPSRRRIDISHRSRAVVAWIFALNIITLTERFAGKGREVH